MLNVEKISKSLGKFQLKDIEIEVGKDDYFVLLGPSGAGKSLTLEIIAGLQKPDSGKIFLNGLDITRESIQKRKIGIVFQNHALFPHFNVYENIAYPLNTQKIKHDKKKNIIYKLAEQLEIVPLLKRNVNSLSAGEKQRVALARVLTLKPHLLLLDEPLASLDVMLKSDIRTLLRKLNKAGQTIIHVTHDYEDAVTLANKIAIINNGIIEHCGTPHDIFLKPKSSFIAKLTGIKNFFPATIIVDDTNNTAIATISNNIKIKLAPTEYKTGKGWIIVRSEDIVISNEHYEFSSNNQLKGKIIEILNTVPGLEIIIDNGCKWAALITHESALRLQLYEGKEVWFSFKSVAVSFIPE